MSKLTSLESKLKRIQNSSPLDVDAWVNIAKKIIPLRELEECHRNVYASETSITRENTAFIDYAIEKLQKPVINLLVVGIGGLVKLNEFDGSRYWSCCASPFELYHTLSQFEQKKVDYNLTVLDINNEHINKLRVAEKIAILSGDISSNYTAIKSWDNYLSRLNVSEAKEQGVQKIYREIISDLGKIHSEIMESALIHTAPLPGSFLDKRSKDEITFVCKDVSDTELPSNNFDMILCNNVMVYSESIIKKQLILYELSRILSSEGLLEVTQRRDHFRFENKIEESIDLPMELQNAFKLRPAAFIRYEPFESDMLQTAEKYYSLNKKDRKEPNWIVFQKK